MTSLLPVVDDFERALSHIEEDKEAEELRKGVLVIYQKFYNTLEQKGLSKIETNRGCISMQNFMKRLHKFQHPRKI